MISTDIIEVAFDPSSVGLAAQQGERARNTVSGLMYWKNGTGDTDWILMPLVPSSGGAPANATYITQTPNASLSNEQALSALATGILKSTTGTGVVSIAAAGTDYQAPGNYITALTGDVTATGPGSVAATIGTNVVDFDNIVQAPGLGVIGKAAAAPGNYAHVTASSDGDVLRVSGGSLGFGTIPVSSVVGAVTAVTASDGLSSSGGTTPNITHDDSALAPGAHGTQGIGSFTTDANGHVTAVTETTFVLPARQILSGAGLTGGGNLSADRTLDIVAADGTIQVNPDSIQVGTVPVGQVSGAVPDTRQIIAGAGLTGGGTLAADRTINVATADGTITVNADSIQVGTIQTANIANLAVTTAKIADLNVTGAKLENAGAGAATYGGTGEWIQSVQVDAKGRVLAVTEATGPPSVTIAGYFSSNISAGINGQLVPSSQGVVAGAGEVPYIPALGRSTYARAILSMYLTANPIGFTESFDVRLERNGTTVPGASTTVVFGQLGQVALDVTTGTGSNADRYAVRLIDNALSGTPRAVAFTWHVTLYN